MQALPQAAFFLFLEAATGGCIALFWVHLRGEVTRGCTLFTGACLLIIALLAVWLHLTFPPTILPDNLPATVWFAIERTLNIAFVVLLAVYLIGVRQGSWDPLLRPLGPVVPLVGLAALWSASVVDASQQLLGLGTPLATLLGAVALGSALAGLSLGHWYLVSPGLGVQPLVRLSLLCLAALGAQIVLLPLLLFLPGPRPLAVQALFGAYAIFFAVRVLVGLLVPVMATVMTWRTARIRSLDSATGLLYLVVALVFTGEITARTLYFLTGITV